MSNRLSDLIDSLRLRNVAKFDEIITTYSSDDIVRIICDIASGCDHNKYDILNTLAWLVFAERQGRFFGQPKHFEVTSDLVIFKDLMYSVLVFDTVGVPREEWEDLLAGIYDICAELGKRKVEIQGFIEKVEKRKREILGNKKYRELYADYLNGAL
jgi:hypothetical protein